MDPWKSWAIVGVVGVGAAYYYSQSASSKRGRGRGPPLISSEQNQRRGSGQRNESKEKRKKKGKSSDTSDQLGSDVTDISSASVHTSSTEAMKKRKGGKKQPSKLAQSSAVEVDPEQSMVAGNDVAEDEGIDNVEFARQLSGLKTGTSLKKTSTQNETKETRKQGKPNLAPPQEMNGSALKTKEVANTRDISTASSTTGADADDDLSPVMSPDLRATQTTTPSSMDVSDMLEPALKGPSILRITEPANPQTARQPKASKSASEPQTKKQRQNKQKNEEKKALREQAEKERHVLLEKQLRTAREAEGRPARNGLGPSQLPSTNAWNKPTSAASESVGPAARQTSVPLLDTFDSTPTTAPVSHGTNGAINGAYGNKKVWSSDLPSEEEQMRMITEMDSDNSWSTVAKGGKSKKKVSAAKSQDKETINSSGDQTKGLPSATSISLATSTNGNKTHFTANSKTSSSTMPATYLKHDNTANSAKEDKNKSSGVMAPGEDDISKTVTSHNNDNDSNSEESANSKVTDAQEPEQVKATYETIDHSVWTRENITEHPDYDPDLPYALTGHPDDDEWAVC